MNEKKTIDERALEKFTDLVISKIESLAEEELVAELTSAVALASRGIEKHLKDDSCTYLKSWLDSLRESPQYLKVVLNDVRKAFRVIDERMSKAESLLASA